MNFASRETASITLLAGMRPIVEVRISPDGERVAHVLSTPSVAKNGHGWIA